MAKFYALLLFLLPFYCLAQLTISGKVINGTDNTAVANASVFLNNAVVGTKTSDNGSFNLSNVKPGQYDLVVSIVGYETYHQTVAVNNNITLADIKLSPKIIALNEVKIKAKDNWERDYKIFKELFLGSSANADQCVILNPDVLDLDYDPEKGTFSAKSDDFIEIENRALGYKVKYLLTDLSNDWTTSVLYYEGSALFEELSGTPADQRRWQKKRREVYDGSSMHFLRSVISDELEGQGFKALRLIRKSNPDYKNGDNIKKKYLETLIGTPLPIVDFVKRTNVAGQFALTFDDCLFVMYNKKNIGKKGYDKLISMSELDNPSSTIISFVSQYALFDLNGVVLNPRSLILEGNWGKNRLPELLPVDYTPL